VILYSYPISPYSRKVAAMLRYKGIEFTEKHVHPLRRGEVKRLSGQATVPVLADGDRIVYDSTRIAKYLDDKYPEKPIYPSDPRERALALLIEDWADEALPTTVMPALYFIASNSERTFQRFRAAYGSGALEDAQFALVRKIVETAMVRKHGSQYGWKPNLPTVLNRLADVLDAVEGTISDAGWLVGDHPTAADFSAWAFLNSLEGLDGWETVRARKKIMKLLKSITVIARGHEDAEPAAIPATDEAAQTPEGEGEAEGAQHKHGDADAEALIDASRLRARKTKRVMA
jgi:glutathione S-transferase